MKDKYHLLTLVSIIAICFILLANISVSTNRNKADLKTKIKPQPVPIEKSDWSSESWDSSSNSWNEVDQSKKLSLLPQWL